MILNNALVHDLTFTMVGAAVGIILSSLVYVGTASSPVPVEPPVIVETEICESYGDGYICIRRTFEEPKPVSGKPPLRKSSDYERLGGGYLLRRSG